MPEVKTVKLDAIIFDPDVYPRQKHDPQLVQRYAESLVSIEAQHNYLSISENLKLVDGRHRQLAYMTAYPNEPAREIPVFIYPVTSDDDIHDLACELNSEHGWQMTVDDKRREAIKMYTRANRATQEYIASKLKVGHDQVSQWLKAILQQEKEDRENTIWSMWLACHAQQEIADEVGLDIANVNRFLQETCEKSEQEDSQVFRNFEPKVYTVWNFAKLTNAATVFGSIPQEIVDNLLYYYTQPFDVVFDPFGGGGSTIDRCIERKRRYYVSDLNPIPARDDIREWDITRGLPDDLLVPDLVFLDPPYWKQAEGRYSEKPTDLGNLELDSFLSTIADITKAIKRKWGQSRPNARLALIAGMWKHEGCYIDLPFLCYQTISKYLELDIRIQVPYSTQVRMGKLRRTSQSPKRDPISVKGLDGVQVVSDVATARPITDRGFHSVRTAVSRSFEERLLDKLERSGFVVAMNGTEHTHSDFVGQLHQSTDQTSLAIRFQPDAVAHIGAVPRSFYLEAKAAKNIERTAYEQYMKLYTNGNVLVVVFEKLDWRWNFIEDVELVDGNETVGRFPPDKQFPVDGAGWITPRKCERWHNIKTHNPQASGTPYREIVVDSLLQWQDFKGRIIQRLAEREIA